MTRTRRVVLIFVLLFVAYAVYNSPAKSADAVHAAWNAGVKGVKALFTFFNALMTR